MPTQLEDLIGRLEDLISNFNYGVELIGMTFEFVSINEYTYLPVELALIMQGNFSYDAELATLLNELLSYLKERGEVGMSDRKIFEAWLRFSTGQPQPEGG